MIIERTNSSSYTWNSHLKWMLLAN